MVIAQIWLVSYTWGRWIVVMTGDSSYLMCSNFPRTDLHPFLTRESVFAELLDFSFTKLYLTKISTTLFADARKSVIINVNIAIIIIIISPGRTTITIILY